ncbi:MAG: Ig-like domain-containing protein, partial [Verrucomicrobiota bacterium]
DIAANAATDTAGNNSLVATQLTVAVDTAAPTPVITTAANPTNSDPFTVTIDFGETVTGLDASDINVGGGTVSGAVMDNGNGNFTATIDPTADGNITIDIAANAATDTAGNNSLVATQLTVAVDTAAPTPVITTAANPTSSDPFTVTIDFGETVTGFDASDINVGGGTVSGALVDNGNGNFTATIDAAADGNITIDVAAGVAQDGAGNNSLVATQLIVTVNTSAPVPVITTGANPTNSDPFTVTIDFGESVTGFDASDINVGGGTVTGAVNDNGSGNFTATIDPTADGTITVDIAANAAQDLGGNNSLVAAQLSVLVDITQPTITGVSAVLDEIGSTITISVVTSDATSTLDANGGSVSLDLGGGVNVTATNPAAQGPGTTFTFVAALTPTELAAAQANGVNLTSVNVAGTFVDAAGNIVDATVVAGTNLVAAAPPAGGGGGTTPPPAPPANDEGSNPTPTPEETVEAQSEPVETEPEATVGALEFDELVGLFNAVNNQGDSGLGLNSEGQTSSLDVFVGSQVTGIDDDGTITSQPVFAFVGEPNSSVVFNLARGGNVIQSIESNIDLNGNFLLELPEMTTSGGFYEVQVIFTPPALPGIDPAPAQLFTFQFSGVNSLPSLSDLSSIEEGDLFGLLLQAIRQGEAPAAD